MNTFTDELYDFLNAWQDDKGPYLHTTDTVGREEVTDDDSVNSRIAWEDIHTLHLYLWCEPTDPDCEGTFSDGSDYYKDYDSYFNLTETEVLALINDLS